MGTWGKLKETGPMPGQHGPGGVGRAAGQPRCEEVSSGFQQFMITGKAPCPAACCHRPPAWRGPRLGLTGDFYIVRPADEFGGRTC